MLFKQKVHLKKINPFDVIESFHNRDFVDFLISFQPVKILKWTGIKNGESASFKFWFFGWKKMDVIHQNYQSKTDFLSFEDHGVGLPFGLTSWKHRHIVEKVQNGTLITDIIFFDESTTVKKFLIKPIMLFPIITRILSYKVWFYFIKNKG
ncbi:MAG: hypothetical protein ACJZ1Q_00045 [Candidatus Neomarinimicrobiota bacterium]|jgi:hypothetical protein|tara:strand:+ start:2640 stop:3092 length:453 start_codon:yes stop_codon:yes gene_type:complete